MTKNKRAIVYIDGFNLYSGIMAKGLGSYRWLNLGALSEIIKPKGYNIALIRYYTAIIKGDKEKHERQQVYLNALKAHLGKQIIYMFGRFQLFPSRCKHCEESPMYCKNCGDEFTKPNEKKTDVNIATAMLVDCFEKRTDSIILVSGDSDFETPLIEIGRMFPSVYRQVVFPPMRKNPKLYSLCENQFSLEIGQFRKAGLLPKAVTNPNSGKEYKKPESW